MSAPSLRLFFEYLECIYYDAEFHEKLVTKNREEAVRDD
jgi:hypothetical protein